MPRRQSSIELEQEFSRQREKTVKCLEDRKEVHVVRIRFFHVGLVDHEEEVDF